MEFIDEEVYPVEASATLRNAFYGDMCETMGHRPNYAICVMKIQTMERDGTLQGLSCEHQITTGTCRAIRMRQEEINAGHAIYFVNRDKMNAWIAERDKSTRIVTSEKSKKSKPVAPVTTDEFVLPVKKPVKPVVAKVVAEEEETNIYAAAINAAIAEAKVEPPKKEVVVTPPPVASPKAGMTLLELARMRLTTK